MNLLILSSKPFFARIINSSSGDLLLLFERDGKIGLDFLGLKLNLKGKLKLFSRASGISLYNFFISSVFFK